MSVFLRFRRYPKLYSWLLLFSHYKLKLMTAGLDLIERDLFWGQHQRTDLVSQWSGRQLMAFWLQLDKNQSRVGTAPTAAIGTQRCKCISRKIDKIDTKIFKMFRTRCGWRKTGGENLQYRLALYTHIHIIAKQLPIFTISFGNFYYADWSKAGQRKINPTKGQLEL